MNYYVDENVKRTERVFPRQGRYSYYRYDMNENPEGLPQSFVDEVLKEVTPKFLSVYPEPDKFIKKYAKFIGVNFENVVTTNGSDMAIRYIMEIFGEKGKDVVTVSPSFEMYRINCSILGLNHKPVNYEKDFSLSIEKIIKSIDDNTTIVVLINPNNPIGNPYSKQEIKQILEKTKSVGAILIVDEAYHYFYEETFVEDALKEENVIVLRTFSKLFSIAACRMGIIISNAKLINYIKNAKLTFETNSFALLFAEKILENPSIIENLKIIEKEGKEYLINTLSNKGYECKNSCGNFVFIKTKNNALKVADKLEKEKKVLVHAYKNDLLKDYLRVTTGSKESMKKFIDALLSVDL